MFFALSFPNRHVLVREQYNSPSMTSLVAGPLDFDWLINVQVLCPVIVSESIISWELLSPCVPPNASSTYDPSTAWNDTFSWNRRPNEANHKSV